MTVPRPKPNALVWLVLSVLVLVLDQVTKAWVLADLPEYTAIPVIEGFWNWYRTAKHGEIAGDDPWDGRTLEWSIPSPPPEHNFDVIPDVHSEDGKEGVDIYESEGV